MKTSPLLTLMLAGMLAAGCASPKTKKTGGQVAAPQPVVRPDASLNARVADYNAEGRFVVLSFPIGEMPQMGQTLFLYRGGLKVGDVLVTGPQRDNNIVADLVSGEAQAGDEVRDR